MPVSILVLGATGHVGAPLVQLLVAGGARVRAATRTPATYTGPGEPVPFAFDDRATWGPALAGVDRLFLLALPGDADSGSYGVALVEAAKAAGVKRVVVLSAMGVQYAPPELGLRAIELAALRSGLEVTILRPNWFLQNFSAGFATGGIRGDGVIALPAADANVSFVDCRDIAAVAARALLDDDLVGRELTLTGPEAVDHAAVAAAISTAAGRPVRYLPLAPEAFAQGMRTMGAPEGTVGMFDMLFASLRAGNSAPVSPDVPEVLGRPAIGVGAFAEDHAATWR